MPKTRGPRGGDHDARGDILRAARAAFAERSYSAVTLRGIAREAGVDPALIHHYFDGKPALFVESVLPHNAEGRPFFVDVVPLVLSHPRDRVGVALVRTFSTTWDEVGGDRFAAGIRGALSGEDALASVRAFLFRELLEPLVTQLGCDEPTARAGLIGSLVIGIGIGRYVARLPEMERWTPEQLAVAYGPTVQRLLDEPLDVLLSSEPD